MGAIVLCYWDRSIPGDSVYARQMYYDQWNQQQDSIVKINSVAKQFLQIRTIFHNIIKVRSSVCTCYNNYVLPNSSKRARSCIKRFDFWYIGSVLNKKPLNLIIKGFFRLSILGFVLLFIDNLLGSSAFTKFYLKYFEE